MFRANPGFGVCVGNFTDHTRLTAHNSFVLVLAETGIVGYTVWLAMGGYCFWMPIVVLRLTAVMDDPTYQEPWTREPQMALTLLIMRVGFSTCRLVRTRLV